MKKRNKKYKWPKRLTIFFALVLLVFIAIVLFIRSPWGQNIIVSKVTEYVSEKTNTKIQIDRLFITFSGNVALEGLYLEDKKGDTLLYSESLEANLAISPLLFGNKLNLKSAEWSGLKANVFRENTSEQYNFNFLLDALTSADSTANTSEAETMQVEIGHLDFKDFELNYQDDFLGIDSKLQLGALLLDAEETNLDSLHFKLDNLELSDTQLDYSQSKAFLQEDTTQAQLPYIAVNNFSLSNVKANYNSVVDSILFNVNINDFLLQEAKADLSNNDVAFNFLNLKNSTVNLHVPNSEKVQDSVVASSKEVTFTWPEFFVKANTIALTNNTIAYKSGRAVSKEGVFNPNEVLLKNVAFNASHLEYIPKEISFDLNEFSFLERSGFILNDLAFSTSINSNTAALTGFRAITNSSKVAGDFKLEYNSVQQLITTPQSTAINLQLPTIALGVNDALFFQPQLIENEYLKKALQHPINGNVNIDGTLADFEIDNVQFKWGETSLVTTGKIQHVMQEDSLRYAFNTINISTERKDILNFVSEEDLGISIPQSVILEASAVGSLDDVTTLVTLKIPEGKAQLTGSIRKENQIHFNGDLQVDSLQLNTLLKNEAFGDISFKTSFFGEGSSINNLNAEIISDFSQLVIKDYDFSALDIKGKITNGKGNVAMAFKDDNLNLLANTEIVLDSINSNIGFDLNVIGADLYALEVSRENIKAALELQADYSGNPQDFKLNATILNGTAVYDNQQYQSGNINIRSAIDSINTEVTIDSDFINGFLKSNASPEGITNALNNQLKNYFGDEADTMVLEDSVQVQMKLKLNSTPILTEVFYRNVERLDSILIQADFDALTKNLNAEVKVPSVQYGGSTIDSLNVLVTGNATNLKFTAGLAGLVSNPIHMGHTFFEGNLKDKELRLDFSSFNGEEKIAHIGSEMTLKKDTLQFHIEPKELILNRELWTIPQSNEILIAKNFLAFKDVAMSLNDQQLSISNTMEGVEKEHVGLHFENFGLQTFLGLLNPDEKLASGLLKGDFILENPFGATGLVANFDINNLEIIENPLGTLSLDASSSRYATYDFNLKLKEAGADLDLVGNYAANETGAQLNLDLNLNQIELKTIEGFTSGIIKDSQGAISGKINVSGTPTSPSYFGDINFNNTQFNISSLNSVFKISEETLKINTEGVYFDRFSIADSDDSNLSIDGSLSTESLINPAFDLKIETEQFKVLNATKEDNELFYGMASMDAAIGINGDLELPRITGKLRIRKVTDVTYVVPESQLDIEERDGVVVFVNREQPDAILTRNDQEETLPFFQGMDVEAVLEIAEDADFHIIIDERTGDNLEVSGDAALNLNIEPNGRINLTGRYELKSGHYETNLYNFVKRRFVINPGSTITWQGDPTDAKLDVIAIYELETSASPLMSSVTSSEDVSALSKYQQVLPFYVYLNVDGELLEPELSFGLDMPEDDQGAIGGAVYTRVQQLNLQESELNKQVFSLLALNRFYADSGSDGSSGGTAAIARDNVNRVLSGQLNTFSDKVFGSSGFEVDFDLDSFTDYQGDSPQDRTQLNINAKKKLFDDRVIVTAGSAVDVEGSAQEGQEETPIIGNVSLEYLLTKDGRYRLKGFRKSEYENIIDGQLIVTGIALIFNREFNKFSQLFNPIKDAEESEQKNTENKAKASNKN
ncbi:translocation/assembly module TamB domain-containing protein [Aurantibacter sp.]|uniref:translocation/assembly module TamB domain-containing protein n=1 Tax=Aurantibacter sp. TaxID=2807103 RepID=UPI003266F36B